MKVVRIESARLQEWDQLVADSPDGTIYHASGWRAALETAFPHIRGHFLAIADGADGHLVAALPVYEVRSWILGNRLVGVPYANWCDPLVENQSQLALLLGEVHKLGEELGCERVELRCRRHDLEEFPSGWEPAGTWKHHFTDLSPDPEVLFSKLSRTAVRRYINRARSQGIEIETDRSREGLEDFHRRLAILRKRLGLPIIPYRFFQSLRDSLSEEEFFLCVARRDGQRLGAAIGLRSRDVYHLEFAAGGPTARGLGVMQLLYWEAMQQARSLGCKEFSFGRTSGDNTGLLAYKRHWNTTEEDLSAISWAAGDRPGPGKLGSLVKPIASWSLERLPGPVCKSLGSLIYRHWG
ncbi:MAG: GNAT family N-acetyltransferase [Verrucomicrobiales bacterium]